MCVVVMCRLCPCIGTFTDPDAYCTDSNACLLKRDVCIRRGPMISA